LRAEELELTGVVLFSPQIHRDARGYFVETYRQSAYAKWDVGAHFVQDNHSHSMRGVIRGLHYQIDKPQGKLVRVSRGSVFDVAVDVRRGSPQFGRWLGVVLDDASHHQLYIPPGFAHGFCVMSESADVVYKCTEYFDPQRERGLLWNDPDIGIDWPLANTPVLSEKDQKHPRLSEAVLPLWEEARPDRHSA
jgi:dTDP-4-dehydrorhamnose 3,5-epimerase